jgi:hypothetical protein
LYNTPPSITSFSPAFGAVGSMVTITGNNFNTDASKNVVFFGPVRATVKTASKTSLQVTVPGGATGQITVTNTAAGLSAVSNLGFNVTNTAGPAVSFSNKMAVPFINTFGSYAIDDFDGDGFADILVAPRRFRLYTPAWFRPAIIQILLHKKGGIDFQQANIIAGSGRY